MSARPWENGAAALQSPAALPGTTLTKDQP